MYIWCGREIKALFPNRLHRKLRVIESNWGNIVELGPAGGVVYGIEEVEAYLAISGHHSLNHAIKFTTTNKHAIIRKAFLSIFVVLYSQNKNIVLF